MDKASAGRQQPSLVILDGRDGAHGPGHRVAVDADEIALVVDPFAVDASSQDVHPEQLVSARVPSSSFAEHALLACAEYGGAVRHAAPSGQQGCTTEARVRAMSIAAAQCPWHVGQREICDR